MYYSHGCQLYMCACMYLHIRTYIEPSVHHLHFCSKLLLVLPEILHKMNVRVAYPLHNADTQSASVDWFCQQLQRYKERVLLQRCKRAMVSMCCPPRNSDLLCSHTYCKSWSSVAYELDDVHLQAAIPRRSHQGGF